MRKKWIGVVIAVLLVLGITGCTTDVVEDSTSVSKSETESVTEPVVLDWYVNYSWFATPWGGNIVSDAITEDTGIHVNFITPIGNETEKLNALIASETLPDIITLGYWEPQVEEMIQKDMVYALNELADTYAPLFWEVADATAVKWYTKEDGNIYGYPNSSISPQDLEENDYIGSNQTFLVRKDIYEALGRPDMTTPEGFMTAVERAKEMFPEVDGEALIPVGAHTFDNEGNVSFDKYLMNFLAIPWEKDGQLYDRYTDSEYIKWLKMFREMAEKGLLATDIFVDTRTQMEEKIAQGRYFCMIYQYTDMLTQQKQLYDTNPEKVYIAVEGPRNASGAEPTLPCTSISGWTVTMISKNCKEPEKAIQFMSYLMSEKGQMQTYLGVEGETYDMVNGMPVLKQEVKELLDVDRAAYDRKYGADNAYWMLQDTVMQQQWRQTASPAEEQLIEWSRKYVVYNGQYEVYLPVGNEAAVADSKIRKLWSETLPKLLLATSEEEFDMLFDEYIEERERIGFSLYMEAATKFMKNAKEKLGMIE